MRISRALQRSPLEFYGRIIKIEWEECYISHFFPQVIAERSISTCDLNIDNREDQQEPAKLCLSRYRKRGTNLIMSITDHLWRSCVSNSRYN